MIEQEKIWEMIDKTMEKITELVDDIPMDEPDTSDLADLAMDMVNLVSMVKRTTEEN